MKTDRCRYACATCDGAMFATITSRPPIARVCDLRNSGRAMQFSKAGMRLACSEQRAATVM